MSHPSPSQSAVTAPLRTRVHKPTPEVLVTLANVLRRGGLVAVPTETVYGLAANALNPAACDAIFSAKNRPANDPLIVHVIDLAAAEQVAVFNDDARRLAAAFWPGPLTLVLPRRACIPDTVTSGRDTVAVRVPAHPVFRKLLRLAGLPLAAPSANPFGYVSPTTAAHVLDGLGGRIRHILDGGPCRIGVESTILDLTLSSRAKLLRPGGLAVEKLEKSLGKRILRPARKPATRQAHETTAQVAPGMLPWHYSPATPSKLVRETALASALKLAGHDTRYLRFGRSIKLPKGIQGLSLSTNPQTAAHALFAALRSLDASGAKQLILAAPRQRGGLWEAVHDRLRRAAARR